MDKKTDLIEKMNFLQEQIDEIEKDSETWEGFQKDAEKLIALKAKYYRQYRILLDPSHFENIPEYGHLMTFRDFSSNCKGGGFIDYDGYGRYANEHSMSDIHIYPSDIEAGNYRGDFTHVVWFNR